MNWDTIQQLVRIVMQIVAGWLAAAGWITEDMVQVFVGSVVSLGGVVWWALWESGRQEPSDGGPLA